MNDVLLVDIEFIVLIVMHLSYLITVNEAMSRRAVHKAILESFALVGVSVLQIYLLRRLFERKLGTSRV